MTGQERVNAVASHAMSIVRLTAANDIKATFDALDAKKVLGDESAMFTSDSMDPFARCFFSNGLKLGIMLASHSIVAKVAELDGVVMPEGF